MQINSFVLIVWQFCENSWFDVKVFILLLYIDYIFYLLQILYIYFQNIHLIYF